MHKNMKIEINEQQPLDEVVKILKAKGYEQKFEIHEDDNLIGTDTNGFYFATTIFYLHGEITTLAELKEM